VARFLEEPQVALETLPAKQARIVLQCDGFHLTADEAGVALQSRRPRYDLLFSTGDVAPLEVVLDPQLLGADSALQQCLALRTFTPCPHMPTRINLDLDTLRTLSVAHDLAVSPKHQISLVASFRDKPADEATAGRSWCNSFP